MWGLAIWCMVEEVDAKNKLVLTRDWVAYWFTWLYIGSQDIWIFFAVYIYAYYGQKKLCVKGKEDEKPEFSDASYFMMLFTCGVAVGMFYYGVTEPTSYYVGYSGNRYQEGTTDSEQAQWAITLSVFHWGLHGWVPYCIVALTLGFAGYRQEKPLTMRSSLYPLLGDRINGWVGDCIDILSIFVVIAGVCTSLGLGTDQIAQGIYRLNTDNFDYTDEQAKKQAWTVIIVLITLVACCSVVSGIHYGIKTIAIVAFMLANFLWLMVFCLDDPVYFLDIMVQSVGHYLQWFLQLGFQTDAFQRQHQHGNAGFGATVDFVSGIDNSSTSTQELGAVNKPGYMFPGAPPDTYASDGSATNTGGNPKYMQWWTIFYWGWWIAWSPFVGMFVARISKGRTIREVFNYSMTAPLFYVIMWFSVFGGAGIKMENTAQECVAAAAHPNNTYFNSATATVLTNPYTNKVITTDTGAGDIARMYHQGVCCETQTVHRAHTAADASTEGPMFPSLDSGAWEILTVTAPYNKTKYTTGILNHGMCEYFAYSTQNFDAAKHTDIATYLAASSLTSDEQAFVTAVNEGTDGAYLAIDDSRRVVYKFQYDNANFYELLEQYHHWGEFLSGVTILTIILYFVTSSDSGSFVVDLISAGGNRDKDGKEKDPHPVQRVIWSLTEGGVAIGLMYAGGSSGTQALQALSVAVGLPFTIVICGMMPALLRMLEIDDDEAKESDWDWKMPIFGGFLDILDVIFSVGGKLGGCPSVDDLTKSFKEMLIGGAPFVHASWTLSKLDVDGKNKTKNTAMVVTLFALWVTWIVSLIMQDHTAQDGWWAFAIVMYVGMVVILVHVRASVRQAQNIKGNMIEDFICCFFLFFNAGPQCWIQVNEVPAEKVDASYELNEVDVAGDDLKEKTEVTTVISAV